MSESFLRWFVSAALCSSAVAAQAQGSTQAASPAARPDPLDAKASVPALAYRSAFAGFRGFGDDKPLPWREANEAVARIGGWRAYAREAQQPEKIDPAGAPAPASPTTPASGGTDKAKPMPSGHHGHQSP